MEELLRILSTWLLFLFHPGTGYRISNSEGGAESSDALIDIEGPRLQWRLVSDRSQLILHCFPLYVAVEHGYSMDILIEFLTGSDCETSILSEQMARSLERHLPEIEAAFEPEQVDQTIQELERLKIKRADKLFGPIPSDRP